MQRIDITASRFGRWQVLSYAGPGPAGAYWHCVCDCGAEKLVNGASLRDGRSSSCGCLRIDHRKLDHTGKRFGFLLVISLAGTRPSKSGDRLYFLCRCDCGKEKIVLGASLVYGSSKSCGRCALISHGEASNGNETTEYRSWSSMRSRCVDRNLSHWKDYGRRGITVCERWASYETFLADMGRKPSPRHSIDRIDVNGNYEPGNCRWATPKEQMTNRRPVKVGRIERFSDAELMAELVRRQTPI